MTSDQLLWINDGLPVVRKRSRLEDKYKTLLNYMQEFSTGMKNSWSRVYVDLYAGSGVVTLEGSSKYHKGSSLLALSVPDIFDKYILCEEDPDLCDALRKRVGKSFGNANTVIVQGDCNKQVGKIMSEVPNTINGRHTLTLCVLDPNSLDVKMNTIRQMASIGKVDFIVLMALMMDANRNLKNYLRSNNKKVEEFLGEKNWRNDWKQFQQRDDSFPRFLADRFEKKIKEFGYKFESEEAPKKEIRSNEKNLPLYHLAFFSKHKKGFEFWKEAIKYSTSQIEF